MEWLVVSRKRGSSASNAVPGFDCSDHGGTGTVCGGLDPACAVPAAGNWLEVRT